MLKTSRAAMENSEKGHGKTAHSNSPSSALPVDGKTIPEAYLRRINLSGGQVAYRIKRDGKLVEVTWDEHYHALLGLAAGLKEIGLKPKDRICILSQTRPEWMIADMASMCSGLVTVPIYHSNCVEDVAFILEHCEAKLVFADDEGSCQKLAQAFALMKREVPVVCFQNDRVKVGKDSSLPLNEFSKPAKADETAADLKKIAADLSAEMMASIVYTSGTTGQPKGAVLTHANITAELRALCSLMELSPRDATLTFLPMAHIMGRIESMIGIFAGVVLNFAESINTVAQNITELKPTLLVSVPRIYEKIYSKIQSEVQGKGEHVQKLFKWAVSVGRDYVRHVSEKKSVPLPLAIKFRVADKLVLSNIRAKLGGNIRITVSGGAPLSPDLCEFFHACGIKVMEAYGLTETTAAITVNRPNDYSFGTVGKTMPETEIKLAADGEILARGSLVFKEYFKNPQATKEALIEGGWFCTGDIGEFTERGFLRITDRKKELIVTSGGKNIAPQKLENLLKATRYISNCMVYGDKEKYLVVLVALNDEIKKWAKAQGLSETMAEIVQSPKVEELIEGEIKQVNTVLAHYETIKKFALVPADFTVETGELTPSLKLKRKIITQKYRPLIDKLYGG